MRPPSLPPIKYHDAWSWARGWGGCFFGNNKHNHLANFVSTFSLAKLVGPVSRAPESVSALCAN